VEYSSQKERLNFFIIFYDFLGDSSFKKLREWASIIMLFFLKFSSAVSEKLSFRKVSNYFKICRITFQNFGSTTQIIQPTLRKLYLVGLPKKPTPHSFQMSCVYNLACGLDIRIRTPFRASFFIIHAPKWSKQPIGSILGGSLKSLLLLHFSCEFFNSCFKWITKPSSKGSNRPFFEILSWVLWKCLWISYFFENFTNIFEKNDEKLNFKPF
jgi:hypothetical protein